MKRITVTFDQASAELVLQALGVDMENCFSCQLPMDAKNYGGCVKGNDDTIKHFHSNTVCMLGVEELFEK